LNNVRTLPRVKIDRSVITVLEELKGERRLEQDR